MNNIIPKHAKVLGVKVSVTSMEEVLEYVQVWLKDKKKFFITTPNPEIIIAAQKDLELRKIINTSDLALPDGTGLKLAGIRERVTGREVFEALLDLANNKKWKMYLLGGSKEVNSAVLAKAQKMYTGLKIKGNSGPVVNKEGYSEMEEDRKKSIDAISDIDGFKPDILFVGFGAPKQEKWIAHNIPMLNIGGAMVVGGAFDYFVGKLKKPPAWMASIGLEWFWRLVQEPKRLGRIVTATVVFPLYLLLYYLLPNGKSVAPKIR